MVVLYLYTFSPIIFVLSLSVNVANIVSESYISVCQFLPSSYS